MSGTIFLPFPGSLLEPELRKIQQGEIASTPKTFRNATKAIIWFDDVPSWTGLSAGITYLSLKYMENTLDKYFDKQFLIQPLQAASAATVPRLELINEPGIIYERRPEFCNTNCWFKSSFTLQEAIVRPDMLLYNANLECLEVAPGIAVGLNDIAALLNLASRKPISLDWSQSPLYVQELKRLFDFVGLENLLSLSLHTSVEIVEPDPFDIGFNSNHYQHVSIVARGGINPHLRTENESEGKTVG